MVAVVVVAHAANDVRRNAWAMEGRDVIDEIGVHSPHLKFAKTCPRLCIHLVEHSVQAEANWPGRHADAERGEDIVAHLVRVAQVAYRPACSSSKRKCELCLRA